jgi:hypothetical protein
VATTTVIGVALVAVSAVALPGEWSTWGRMLSSFAGEPDVGQLSLTAWVPAIPLAPRLLLAAIAVVWGARTRTVAVLPIVLLLSQPDLQSWELGYLAALPRLWLPRLPNAASRRPYRRST